MLLLLHFAMGVLICGVVAWQCPLGHFPCGNLSDVCLPQPLHCNNVVDCGNGADEENCGDNSGWPQLFDKFFGVMSPYSRKGKLTECLLEIYPKSCTCQGKELDCDGLNLRSIPNAPPNITVFSLQKNRLRTLPALVFRRYASLEKLYLQNNQIRSVSSRAFSGLHNLTRLYLSHNHIAVLKPRVFQDLRWLEWLIIDNNRLIKISQKSFLGLQSLVMLVLLNNTLHELPRKSICKGMPQLNWFDLEGNQIQSVRNSTFLGCDQLTVLVLQRNALSLLGENTFSPLKKLGELDISANKIQKLPLNIFQNLQELSNLNLSYNPSLSIHSQQFDFLKSLESLSMEGIEINNIQNRMFKPLRALSHIYFKKFQYCGYAPHVRSCKPNTDGISSFEDLLANVVLRVFVWVVAFATCFGNLFVVCMRTYIRAENQLHALSIKSLCCADCLMGVYLFFVGAYDLRYRGEYNRHAQLWMASVPCRIMGSLAMLSTEVSVLLLTYLTIEKYLCIVFPFSNFRPKRCRTFSVLTAIWLLGFAVAFTPLWNEDFFGNYYGRNGVCFPLHSDQTERPGAQAYSVAIFLGVNLIAFVTIVFCYISMFCSVRRTGLQTAELCNRISKEIGIAKRFFFIVFTDALCWLPIFLLKLLSLLHAEIPGVITSWVVIFILPINSALNPILYTLTTRYFREKVRHLLREHWRRRSELSEAAASAAANGAVIGTAASAGGAQSVPPSASPSHAKVGFTSSLIWLETFDGKTSGATVASTAIVTTNGGAAGQAMAGAATAGVVAATAMTTMGASGATPRSSSSSSSSSSTSTVALCRFGFLKRFSNIDQIILPPPPPRGT
ncbi:unnamed protein product [Lampetra planeri]